MHSKCRPPSGERCRLIVGPRTTSTPLRTASPASAAPIRERSSSSQVAAMAEPEGKAADGSSSVSVPPRTPTGPSETVIVRSPISGTACSVHGPEPDRSRTLVSRSSFVTRASRSASDSGRGEDTVLLELWGRSRSEGGDALGVVAGGEGALDQPQGRALGHADVGGQRAAGDEGTAGRRGLGGA